MHRCTIEKTDHQSLILAVRLLAIVACIPVRDYAIRATSAILAWIKSWWNRGGAMGARFRSWWPLHRCAVMEQIINGEYLDARVA
jgi:hypothetical protein